MALGTGGPDSMGVLPPVDVGGMCFFERLHTVAADTKSGIRGGCNPFVGDEPGKKGQNDKCQEYAKDDDHDAGKFLFGHRIGFGKQVSGWLMVESCVVRLLWYRCSPRYYSINLALIL